jgi:hypothetical protein
MLQAFSAGADLDVRSERLLEARTEAEGRLTGAQLAAAAARAAQRRSLRQPARRFGVDVALRFPKVGLK